MIVWLRPFVALKVFLWVFVLFLAWQIIMFMWPRPRELTPLERAAVDRFAAELVERIQAVSATPARVGVAHFHGDPGDHIATALRAQVEETPEFTGVRGSPVRRFLSDVSSAVANASSLEEIVRAGQRVEMDILVAGRVKSIGETNQAAHVIAQAFVYDTRPGKWILSDTLHTEFTSKSASTQRHSFLRWLLWLLLVGALPWVCSPTVVWTLEKKQNRAATFLLGGLLVVDMAFLCLLAPTLPATGWFLLLAGLALAYTYWACETIAKKQGG